MRTPPSISANALPARRRPAAAKEVRLPDEIGDEPVDRVRVDLLRRAELLDAPLAHHGDAIGEHQRFFLVVRDEDRRQAEPSLQPLHFELHLLAQFAVERAERLVEQQQSRVEDDRARERDALLLAARKLARQPRTEIAEIDELQDRRDALANPALGTLRISSGNAMFCSTVRCGNSA